MKKRFFAALCAVALCLGLFPWALHAEAADDPCFAAVNYRLLDLEDRFMPILVSGQYYVPYNVFDHYTTSIDLGVYPTLNRNENTVSLYSREKFLTFDLSTGVCTDRDGQSYSARAFTRNNQVYIPALFVCDFFDLSCSILSTEYGPLVRIKNASSNLSDSTFVDAATLLMGGRLAKWQRAQDSTPSTQSPTAAPTPTPGTPDRSSVAAYVAVHHTDSTGLSTLLDAMSRSGIYALFFFPADNLADYDEQIRRVLCSGHSVGLAVSGFTAEELIACAERGNETLSRIAYLRSNIILPEQDFPELPVQALSEAGLLCWNADLTATPDGRSSVRQASALVQGVADLENQVYLTLEDTVSGAALGIQVLRELDRAGYNFWPVTETAL